MKEAECITSITLLKSPAEFTMICAPKIFFHLVSLQGLIQTDLKPSALKRVRLHKWLCSHSKQNRKRGFTCVYKYVCVQAHIEMISYFSRKGGRPFKASYCHQVTEPPSMWWCRMHVLSAGQLQDIIGFFHQFQPTSLSCFGKQKSSTRHNPSPVSWWVSLLPTNIFTKVTTASWCQM